MNQPRPIEYPALEQKLTAFHTQAAPWFMFLTATVYPIGDFEVLGGEIQPPTMEDYKEYWPQAKIQYPKFKIDRAVDHFRGYKIDLGGDTSLESRGMGNVQWAFKETIGRQNTLLSWEWTLDDRDLPRLQYRLTFDWATWKVVALFDGAGDPVPGAIELYHESGNLPITENKKGNRDEDEALNFRDQTRSFQPSQEESQELPCSDTVSLASTAATRTSGPTLVPSDTGSSSSVVTSRRASCVSDRSNVPPVRSLTAESSNVFIRLRNKLSNSSLFSSK